MKKLYSLDPPPQNGRDWSSLMSKMDMGRRRQGWLCPVPFDAGQITSMSLYPVGRWDNLVSFYFKRLRMVWWQPWRESPSPLLTCCCLMPRSSNPFPPCAWTWRETAMPSRMWMPLRCRALLTHFFIKVDRLTLLADCGWLTRVKQLPSLALTESALQKYLSLTSPKVSGWLGWYQIPFPPENKLVTSHVPPHNRHTLFKQIVVDLSHGPSDAYAYLSDFASGRVLTFRLKLPLILKEDFALCCQTTCHNHVYDSQKRYHRNYCKTAPAWNLASLGQSRLRRPSLPTISFQWEGHTSKQLKIVVKYFVWQISRVLPSKRCLGIGSPWRKRGGKRPNFFRLFSPEPFPNPL